MIDWDENIYAAAGRYIAETGNFLRYEVNGELFIEKPPFFLGLIAVSDWIFGINEASARIPSVISGLLSAILLYIAGKKLYRPRVGAYWAVIYSTSLLPLLLARTCYIDHWFNFFIGSGILGLLLGEKFPKKKWKYGLLAGVAMGIGVLTKGPLAIVIPGVAYVGMKVFSGELRKFPWGYTILVFFWGLLVASSWYLANLGVYGPDFLMGFVEFQRKLLTKPLESHHGPFFYHFIVAPIGLLPWTGFLLALTDEKIRKIFWAKEQNRKISLAFLSWIGFVLAIFSIVQTKLPHYSSSIYLPLSFFIARILEYRERKEYELPKKATIGFFLGYFFLVALFLLVPAIVDASLEKEWFREAIQNADPKGFGFTGYIPGIVLLLGFLLGIIVYPKKNQWFFFSVLLTMSSFLSLLSFLWMPRVIEWNQSPQVELTEKAFQEGGEIILYKYLSFAPMYYQFGHPVYVIGNYKFTDRTDLLQNTPKGKNFFIITPKNNQLELNLLYGEKRFRKIQEKGNLILLELDPDLAKR